MIELNQRELAREFGVTTRQIRNWEEDGLPCREEPNRKCYPLAEVLKWYRERRLERSHPRIAELRARKLELEVERKEVELAELTGKLVPIEHVDGLLREALKPVAGALHAAPGRLAPELTKRAKIPESAARRILKDLVEDAKAHIRESVG